MTKTPFIFYNYFIFPKLLPSSVFFPFMLFPTLQRTNKKPKEAQQQKLPLIGTRVKCNLYSRDKNMFPNKALLDLYTKL